MNNNSSEEKTHKRRGLSLQQRLSLLIALLLLCTIVICSYISYIAVKNTAIHAGEERLRSLTQQLSNMFGQSMQTLITTNQPISSEQSLKQTLRTKGAEKYAESFEILKNSIQDKGTILVSLVDTGYHELIRCTKDSTHPIEELSKLTADAIRTTPVNRVGNLYEVKDSMYFPVVLAVRENQKLIGYVVRWRLQYASPQAISQFVLLLGSDATLYVGNKDGSLWTDLGNVVKAPAADTPYTDLLHYSNAKETKVLANAQSIPQTTWLVLVEFSQEKIMESPRKVLQWILIAGGILLLIALLLTWHFSRNMTRPLNKLNSSASAIANGDYTIPVVVNRKDEIGELAHSFNTMKERVEYSQHQLENKVQERTIQLEKANKELEAFSYTVSHDLRAPLRAVNGFALILKEDYASKMDEEANRLADKIILNSKRMGQLIDDLIAFSQMGSKELVPRMIDMHELARTCLQELLHHEPEGKYSVSLADLPPCAGDESLIKQVWMNLLGNAIKYSAGTEQAHIRIGYSSDEQMHTYFVRDNGVGFSMKYADKLFGVFQRLHSSKNFEGTGIGLAFAKRIIEKHRGQIWADAEPGEGATFYFSLPKTINNEQ